MSNWVFPAAAKSWMLTIVPTFRSTFCPSSHTSMPAVVLVFLPAAVIMNGEVTVEPFTGEQMFTPGDAGCGQDCATPAAGKSSTRTDSSAAAGIVPGLNKKRDMGSYSTGIRPGSRG